MQPQFFHYASKVLMRKGGWLYRMVLLSLLALPLGAQENHTRFELGAQFSTIQLTPPGGGSQSYPGFGGRLDLNLTRRLALETEVDFFPEHTPSLFRVQGGQSVQAVFGVRARVIETRRISVFGLVRPGLLHFTDTLEFSSTPGFLNKAASATYFQLNLGGGFEYYPSERWILRADIAGNPSRIGNTKLPLGPGISQPFPGKIEDTTRISVGIAYRPGRFIENEAERPVNGKLEIGALSSAMVIAREGVSDGVRTEFGLGGYASYNIYKVFYADGSLLFFPRDTVSSGAHDGGEIVQGLFGLKGGIRRNRFGFFGKVRPGFHSYSRALTSITAGATGFANGYGRSTNLVLDLGGIIEFYPAEHGTLRLEIGDTHVYFGTREINVAGTHFSVPGGDVRHTIQCMVGYGWRF
jgi:hypothetical protein